MSNGARFFELTHLGNGAPLRIAVDRPIPFPTAVQNNEEHERLLPRQGSTREVKETISGKGQWITTCSLLTALVFGGILTVMAVVLFVRVDYLVKRTEDAIVPHLAGAVDDVATMLGNTASMSNHVNSMTAQGDGLLAVSVPRLIGMINQTQALLHRFEHFSQSPTLNLAVG